MQEEENKIVVFDSQKILAASDHGIFPLNLKSTLPSSLFCLPMEETQVQSLGGEDPLEEEMATQSNILVWKSRQEESGWLQSIRLQRVRLYLVTKQHLCHIPQILQGSWF